MGKTVNILAAFRQAKGRHWWEAIYWLLYTIFGAGLPVYGGWFLLTLLSRRVGFVDFCRDGEFVLYSAAILGATLHLISKGGRRDMFVNMRFFVLLSFILLLLATLIFAGVTVASLGDSTEVSVIVNQKLLIPSSIVILILTILVAFLVNLLDSVRFRPDPY